MEIYGVKEVEQNPVPKSQTKPFYIGTKEAPSETVYLLEYLMLEWDFYRFILRYMTMQDADS